MKFPAQPLRQGTITGSICSSCRQTSRKDPFFLRASQRHNLRTYRIFVARQDKTTEYSQAQPLGGFYEDLLASPVPQATQSKPSDPQPKSTGPKIFYGAERKYRGGISDTPDSTWRTINGVPIPPRPDEPDNCCMSGCVHCVWDDYRDEIEGWAVRLREAQAKAKGHGLKGSPKVALSRPEVASASGSMDDDGGGSEGLWDAPSIPEPGEDLFEGIPVGIRQFMATEKMLRDRKKTKNKNK